MKKILFLSTEGSSFPLAAMMLQEGHDIRFFTKNPVDKRMGDGFVPKTEDWKEDVKWCDYVICDDTHWGAINDSIRKLGVPVVGGTALSDALEEDRGAGQRMFRALGMDTLQSEEFHSIPEAIEYVSQNPRRYVVKVTGAAAEDKSTTYVGEMEDGSDIGPVLEHLAKKGTKVASVELQDAIRGTEVALGGFFNGTDFLDPIMVNFEHKRLMPNRMEQAGHGPAVGEMGTVGLWRDKGFKFYRETLERFIPVLAKEGYCGYFDINCIIHSDYERCPDNLEPHIHPLEMTNRFGWPTLLLQMETMKINDLGELFYGIATGKTEHFSVSAPYSCCVVIGVPPFPYEDKKIADAMSNGLPVIFRDPSMEGIYPKGVILEDDQWVLECNFGYALVCVGRGEDVLEARNEAYHRVRNVVIPNAIWREDIGDLIPEKIMCMKSFLEYETEEIPV